MLRVLANDEIAAVHGGLVYFECRNGTRIQVTVTQDPVTGEIIRTEEITHEPCTDDFYISNL